VNEQQVRKLGAESMVDVRTIRRFLQGESVRGASRERIMKAAKKLRLEEQIPAKLRNEVGR